MAITYNTGTTGTLAAAAAGTSFTFTVPAGVLTGDVMFLVLDTLTFTPTTYTVSTPSSGGGSWTPIGSFQSGVQGGGLSTGGGAWYRVATASDPSSTLTITWTGSTPSPNEIWWGAALTSYTGASTSSPIDVSGQNTNETNTSTIGACPSKTTVTSGDWAVYLCSAAVTSSGTITGVPSGSTSRENGGTSGINGAISDSNGSVGAGGASIGGGSFTGSAAASWTVFTVGLAPAGAGGSAPPPLPFSPGQTWLRQFRHRQTLFPPGPPTAVSPAAGLATATGTAYSTGVEDDTSGTGQVTGAGAAGSPVASLGADAVLATGTGAALSPGAQITTSGTGQATGTGAAGQPVASLSVNAGLATATGAALNIGVGLTPAIATGTGTAYSTGAEVDTSGSGDATGSGAAGSPGASLQVNAGLATATGGALNAGVQIIPPPPLPFSPGRTWIRQFRHPQTVVPPGAASGTVNAGAGLATASGTAYSTGVEDDTSGTGQASGSGAAGSPGASLTVKAGLATASGTAQGPSAQVTVTGTVATGTGAAGQPVVKVTVTAQLATGTGAAGSITFTTVAVLDPYRLGGVITADITAGTITPHDYAGTITSDDTAGIIT